MFLFFSYIYKTKFNHLSKQKQKKVEPGQQLDGGPLAFGYSAPTVIIIRRFICTFTVLHT